MNTRQNNKLRMYIAVRDYIAKFLAILTSLPNFEALRTLLSDTIVVIEDAEKQQELDKSGLAAAKTDQKKLLARLAEDVAIKLLAFAKLTNNASLKKEMDISETDLFRLTDVRLKNKAQVIHDTANTHLTDLKTYQVTAAALETLQTAIDDFDDMIGKPRVGQAETSKATKQLAAAIKTAEDTLYKMDAVIEIIHYTQLDFYNGYQTARKPVNYGKTSTAIKGMIINAATGEGVKGAKVALTLNGNGTATKSMINRKPDFIKKSAAKGGFLVANAPDGTYHVLVTLPGFKTAESSVSVVAGQMSVLTVMLEKE